MGEKDARRMPWFRWYVEAMADPKLRSLKPEHRWLWVGVLSIARSSPVPGALFVGTSRSPLTLSAREIGDLCALPTRTVTTGLAQLEARDLIHHDPDLGTFTVTAWDRRQFPSDTSTDRVRAYRDRQAATTLVPETLQERSGNAPRNAPESESDASSRRAVLPQPPPHPVDNGTADTANLDLDALALAIAHARAERLGTTPSTRWLKTTAANIDRTRLAQLQPLNASPATLDRTLDGQQPEPTRPPTTNRTGCPTCADTRWIETDDGAIPCPTCTDHRTQGTPP